MEQSSWQSTKAIIIWQSFFISILNTKVRHELCNVFSCQKGTHPIKNMLGTKRFWAQDDTLTQERLFSVITGFLRSTEHWFMKGIQTKSREGQNKKGWGQSWQVQQEQTIQTCKKICKRAGVCGEKPKGCLQCDSGVRALRERTSIEDSLQEHFSNVGFNPNITSHFSWAGPNCFQFSLVLEQ